MEGNREMHCIVELGPAYLEAEGKEGERGVKEDSHVGTLVISSMLVSFC